MAEVTAPQEWVEVYAASGIAATTEIYIQNKGNFEVYVFAGAEPAADARVGWMLGTGDVVQIAAGESEVWARVTRERASTLYVQVV